MLDIQEHYQDTQHCKGMEVLGNSHCPNSHCGSTCYSAKNTKSHHTQERLCLLEFATKYSTRMSELCCSPVRGGTTQSPRGSHCLVASWTCEMHYIQNGTHTTESSEKAGFWSLSSAQQCSLFWPDVWCTQPGQIPIAAATITSKDQVTSIIFIEGETFLYKFDLRLALLWSTVIGWANDGNTFLQWAHTYAQQRNKSNPWVCGQLVSLGHQGYHGGYHHSRNEIGRL